MKKCDGMFGYDFSLVLLFNIEYYK